MTRTDPALLMTRTPDASARFFDQLPEAVRARLDLHVSPLIDIVPVPGAIAFADAMAVIFTSVNGVAMASGRTSRRDLPVYCVGEVTTQAAVRAGWNARFLGASGDELVPALLTEGEPGPILHLCGRHTRGQIAERLSASGCPTRRQPVYDQVLRPLEASAKALLAGPHPVIAPVFSPRTAQQFAREAPNGVNLHLIALSPAVAASLAEVSAASLIVAERPDAQSMAGCLQTVLNRLCRVESSRSAQ